MDGPAYSNTALTLPAHTLVTVTIVNQDPGDSPLPAGSSLNTARGTSGGVTCLDGLAYGALDPAKVAHTFTIPRLGISMPVRGEALAGHQDITVTFSFMTGAAGTYRWQCMDPCDSDPGG